MKKNYFTKRYSLVYNFFLKDRTFSCDTPEEKQRKDLLRKATYVTVIDGKVKALSKATVYVLRNVNGEVNNLLGRREGDPLRNINYDPCEKYRAEYIKQYGGKAEDLEQ